MKPWQFFLTLLVCAAVAAGVTHFMTAGSKTATGDSIATANESAYARVMRTGTIRCGYMPYPKFLERDLNTRALSGIMVELMDMIGQQLSLKIDWTEEVGFASAFDGLETGRYDVMCMPFNQTPGRARVTEFTVPVLFAPYYLYARVGDTRFDNAYGKINDPAVKVAILEGELSQTVKKEEFPKAQTISMPDITDISQVLLQVAMGKADAAMTEPSSAEPFLLKNPGKLKRVNGPSLRMQAAGLDVGVGEGELRAMLDTTIRALYATGFIPKLLDKYTTSPDQFFYAAEPWGKSSQPMQEK
ncbi:MAG: transporter substrate-binding domain-containing protein [Alphaproteobacteria bacterium]|nr:transporter substrate-binding domain-containing protein [Alphaproteobacteria bacterium]